MKHMADEIQSDPLHQEHARWALLVNNFHPSLRHKLGDFDSPISHNFLSQGDALHSAPHTIIIIHPMPASRLVRLRTQCKRVGFYCWGTGDHSMTAPGCNNIFYRRSDGENVLLPSVKLVPISLIPIWAHGFRSPISEHAVRATGMSNFVVPP
ncbi:hypothetical protein BD779DRAFT_646908 [Infundibulicybe gibba]|nr:hypothetical protein BD779DRAFT_646908 [Infundibulicybe gibba]